MELKMLSEKQRNVFQHITSYTNVKGQSPSYGSMAKKEGVTRTAIQKRVEPLIDKGYLVIDRHMLKPTIDGIKQYIKDTGTSRIKKSR